MSATMKVVLEGLPERIQEAADILERAFPGTINWHRHVKLGQHNSMQLEGVAFTLNEALRPPDPITPRLNTDQTWELDLSAARKGNQRNRFCVSLSRSFQP